METQHTGIQNLVTKTQMFRYYDLLQGVYDGDHRTETSLSLSQHFEAS